MNRYTRCCLMSSFLFLHGQAVAEDAQQIRKLIPAATAMRNADMEALATSEAPSYADISDKSLTLQLFAMKPNSDRTKEQLEEYKTLVDIPKPSELAAEIYRVRRIGSLIIPLGPVTAIHAERITDFTCTVDDDDAQGTVSFKVPDLYQGKVQYVAQRKNGKWQITEFLLPAHGIHIVRGDSGLWSEKE